MTITLPWPPSVNTYWRHPTTGKLAGRHLISEQGRAYREAVRALVAESRTGAITGPVRVEIEAYRPDKRRRDLDNILKSLLDSLTYAGVWADDSQVVDLRIYWADTIGGMVKVTIKGTE
jgi:crossover junction endodeoxyribonuclease RusA